MPSSWRVACVLVSAIALVHSQQYVVQRDFRTSYQYNSFVVLTPDEQQVIYRIETQYSLTYSGTIKYLLPLADSITVGHIDAFLGSSRIFTFRILNSRLGQWIDGRIYQRAPFVHIMELGRFQQLVIQSTPPRTPEMSSLNVLRFSDGLQMDRICAAVSQRSPWLTTYDLRLFTNEYPVEVYLVGLAVVQRYL